MLMIWLQASPLIKERSSRPLDHNPLITQHSHLIGLPCSLTFLSTLPMSQGLHPVLVVCSLMTHIGFHCIRCIVIVPHLSSWSDNPHLLLSSFNPYLPDPLTLLLLIHLSHNNAFPLFSLSHDIIVVLLIFRELSHYLVTVTHHTSLNLGTINV